MTKTRFALCLLAGLALVSITALRSPAQMSRLTEKEESQLVTLYAHDDLQSSFDFREGKAGGRYADGNVELTGAHLAFDLFERDMISYGFLRDDPVRILDLGEFFVPVRARSKDRAPRLSPSLFHSLFRDGKLFAYLGQDGEAHPCREANDLLGPLPGEGYLHLQPQVGHTYLVRIGHRRGGEDDFAKFEIVDFQPGHSLTIRWALVPER
jgi:hypothetical protein